MKKFLSFIFVFSFITIASAQTVSLLSLEQFDRKEIYVEINLKSNLEISKQLELLEKTVSIDNYNNLEKTARAYISINNYTSFLKTGFDFQILTAPSLLLPKSELDKTPNKGTYDWNYYPSYSQYLEMMYQFEEDYPNLCEVVNIGQSIEGRDILFVHINNNLGEEVDEPEFMYTSTIHGDEVTGYVLMLRLIDHLLVNYSTDSRIENMVNEIDIWINPLANPDGTYAGGNNSVSGAMRYNANFIDLNRNYADPEDGDHPDGNTYQTETVHFMDFADEHNFVMSANLHTGAEVINYPWDTWAKLAADDSWWNFVSREYADTVHVYGPAGYFTDLDNGVTNGYQWYTISGGRQDYMNYFKQCREVTMELSTIKMPSGNQLPQYWEANYRSLLNYMEQVLYGVRGIVTDAVNDTPLKAKVFINSHDIDESHVYSSFPAGNYNRLLKQGIYSFTFSALGHFDKTISMVNTDDYLTTILNLALEPNVGAIETKELDISISPNPATNAVNLKLPKTNSYEIRLIDGNGKIVQQINSSKGEVKISLIDYPTGNYIILLSNEQGETFSKKLIVK